jgi:hypothetical protein
MPITVFGLSIVGGTTPVIAQRLQRDYPERPMPEYSACPIGQFPARFIT